MIRLLSRKILSFVLIISFCLSLSSAIYAKTNKNKKIDSNTLSIKQITDINELKADGVTDEEAKNILNLQNIMNDIKQNGQRIKSKNDKYYLSRPDLFKKAISKENEKKLLKLFNQLPSLVADEKTKCINDLNKLMEVNPDKKKYQKSFEDGSWVSVEFESENKNGQYTDIFDQEGKQTVNFILKIYYPMHYCKVNMRYTYNVFSNNEKVELQDIKQEISYAGMFEVDKTSNKIFINETSLSKNPKIWCSGSSEVFWKNNQDILDCNYFCYWTQIQDIDISLIKRHHRISR